MCHAKLQSFDFVTTSTANHFRLEGVLENSYVEGVARVISVLESYTP